MLGKLRINSGGYPNEMQGWRRVRPETPLHPPKNVCLKCCFPPPSEKTSYAPALSPNLLKIL